MIFKTKKQAAEWLSRQAGWYKDLFELEDGRFVAVVLRGGE